MAQEYCPTNHSMARTPRRLRRLRTAAVEATGMRLRERILRCQDVWEQNALGVGLRAVATEWESKWKDYCFKSLLPPWGSILSPALLPSHVTHSSRWRESEVLVSLLRRSLRGRQVTVPFTTMFPSPQWLDWSPGGLPFGLRSGGVESGEHSDAVDPSLSVCPFIYVSTYYLPYLSSIFSINLIYSTWLSMNKLLL